MAKKVVPPSGKGLINQFEKGESGNPNGRPRKVVLDLKRQGYTMGQINETIKVMLSMTKSELQKIDLNDSCTILERTVARSMIDSAMKKNLSAIETLLNRTFGRPKEPVEHDLTQKTIEALKIKKYSEMTIEELENERRKRKKT